MLALTVTILMLVHFCMDTLEMVLIHVSCFGTSLTRGGSIVMGLYCNGP